MNITKDDNGNVTVEGSIKYNGLQALENIGVIESISFEKLNFLAAKHVAELSKFKEIRELRIWCDFGRSAMKHIVKLQALERLELMGLGRPGRKLCAMNELECLKSFSAAYSMIQSDFVAVSTCHSLEELRAQGSNVTPTAIKSLVTMPLLRYIDFESSNFDDDMAEIIAESESISALDLGSTRLTSTGLAKICQMKLSHLDVWATDISEEDLELLANISCLESLSIGGYDGQKTMTAEGVIPRLKNLKALKRLWLDGVEVNESQAAELKDRYEYFYN